MADCKECFHANVAALKQVDPQLAAGVETCVLPEDLEIVETFDGLRSFRSSVLGPSGWLGHTGMPSISEQVVVDRLEHGGANVLLPGAGQGFAISLLLERFAVHQSVFVWEREVLNVALMLRLYDVSAAIAAHRLGWFYGPGLEEVFIGYFSDRRLLTVPTKIMLWPWIPDSEGHGFSQQVERAITTLHQHRAVRFKEASDRVANLKVATMEPDRPTAVFVCSLSAQPVLQQFAEDVSWGLETLGHRCNVFLLDRPEHASKIALADALADAAPQLIVSIGTCGTDWPVTLPADMPMASVLSLPGSAGDTTPAKISKSLDCETSFVGRQSQADEAPDKVISETIGLAVNPDVFRPLDDNELTGSTRCDVLLLADAGDLRCETYGVVQGSHQAIWEHLVAMITHDPLCFDVDRTEALFDQACRAKGVRFDDVDVAKRLIDLVTRYLGPIASAVGAARALQDGGYTIAILGAGWRGHGELADVASQIPRDRHELNRRLNAADMALYLDQESNWRALVFDALCSGTPVLARTIARDRCSDVEAVRDAMICLSPDADLIGQVNSAHEQLQALRLSALRARAYLAEHHSFAKLAETIIRRCV